MYKPMLHANLFLQLQLLGALVNLIFISYLFFKGKYISLKNVILQLSLVWM